ncbi:MAG: GMC family oxidoreductase [Acetobacteraceae bacterium]
MSHAPSRAALLTADYVIVGGGSAGCVVAARLSEDPHCKVVLVEAGDRDRSPYIHLPVAYYKTTGPAFTWGYRTAPQADQGRLEAPYPQGRVLGGGSSINAQVYIRGRPEDFDGWRDAFGCPGWGYADVLPYFVKAEGNQRLSSPVHGFDGPLLVSDPAFTHPLTYAWLKACQQAGLPYNTDFNSGTQAGCGLYQVTNRAGRRSSTAHCYLHPVEGRSNLRVLVNAMAVRIVVENGRATGVEILRGGRRHFIQAGRELVLTAGVIGTAKLLMLSGIGDADELKAKGIEVVSDQPEVGRNLHDHLDVFLVYKLARKRGYDRYKKPGWQLWAGLQFALFRTGPVTSSLVEGGAFWWVDRKTATPDVQFHFLAGAGVEADIPYLPAGEGCTLHAYLVGPKARGRVTLRSAEPSDAPVIDPNFLGAPQDLAQTVAAVRLGRRIMAQPAMRAELTGEHLPGPRAQSEDALAEFVRAQGRTAYHPCGTCRMGTDDRAVVDTELRLRAVGSVRIADASIMPKLISGNTNATAIMIGERCADFIKESLRHGLSSSGERAAEESVNHSARRG